MDKVCKMILNKMIASGKGTEYLCSRYDSTGDIFIGKFANDLGIDCSKALAAMEHLVKKDYLRYEMSGRDKLGYKLTYEGLNWRSFRRAKLLYYIADKWVDIFASIISLVSLFISIAVLMQG